MPLVSTSWTTNQNAPDVKVLSLAYRFWISVHKISLSQTSLMESLCQRWWNLLKCSISKCYHSMSCGSVLTDIVFFHSSMVSCSFSINLTFYWLNCFHEHQTNFFKIWPKAFFSLKLLIKYWVIQDLSWYWSIFKSCSVEETLRNDNPFCNLLLRYFWTF